MGTSSAQVKYGSLSYLITATSAANLNIGTYEGTTGVPVTVGASYTFSYYTRAATSTRLMSAAIVWYDSSGATLSTSAGATVSNSTTAFTPRAFVTATAPASAAYAGVQIRVNSPASGETFYADGLLFEQSNGASAYFDGSSTATADFSYAWTGTAHASTSVETKLRRVNTLSNPNGESGTTSWSGSNATLASDTSIFHGGSQSIKMTSTSTSMTLQGPATASAELQAYGQGTVFTFSAWVYAEASGVSVVSRLFNGLNTDSSSVALTANTWTRVSVTGRYNNNDGTASARSERLVFSGVASGTVVYADDMMLEASDGLGSYFDGSTTAGGVAYAWTGTANASSSTATPTGAYVKDVYNSPDSVTTANPTIAVTSPIDSGDVLVLIAIGSTSLQPVTGVSGCGATWTLNSGATDGDIYDVWVGTGATSTGTVTLTATADTSGRVFSIYHAAGTTSTVAGVKVSGTGIQNTPVQQVAPGQIIFASGYSNTSASALYATAPASGWVEQPVRTMVSGARFGRMVHRIPTLAENASITINRASGNAYASQIVLGNPVSGGQSITSQFSGAGTLTSSLVYTKRVTSGLSGTGTLGSKLVRNIASPLSSTGSLASALSGYQRITSGLSGSGALTSVLGQTIHANFSGSGTLASALRRYISSDLDGTGTLTSRLTGYLKIDSALSSEGGLSSTLTGGNLGKQIASVLSGRGTLVSRLTGQPRQLASQLSSEGVLYSDLAYVIQPQPLAELPLGKLVRYTVNNFAVPLNPADGSGSTPSVNATYIKGKNPEFALGEDFTVDNGAVGRYTGEIVRLSLNKKSDVATISTDTMLTKTNVEKHLYPFIDTTPGLWTAARAIDYWTQQCGAFYDAVDGEVSVYASGFGHTNGFALGIEDSHFYDKVTAGAVSSTVLNGRTVTSFGSAATTVMAQHEATKTRVPITVSQARKMVFSFGVAIRGTGRTASVTYNFIDGSEHTHAVRIEVTSAGVVTAKVEGTTVHTLTAPGPGNYRVSFSIQRMSPTAMAGKLTLHSDDLDGSGALLVNGTTKVFGSTLPGTLWLTSVDHASTGGSGAEMLRWGTYLSVAKFHPLTLPAVQKELGQSKKPLAYVSGFSGNVWKLLNEFCSINRLDVSYLGDRIVLGPRANGFSGSVKFSDFTVDSERREKYKQVAVVNKRSKAVTTGDAVFWRADSVFQVAAREVFETTVQTGHSILNLSQPQAVTGITPFPYKQGTGQYVVTGADGYIISPAWWYDNGGKVEVSMTETEGEIAIKITAPTLDTVRAPYRISEGEGDRPALYISGSGIMNDPAELHIATGAKNAREGFDNVFESPFIATTADAYNTAARMALQYSAAMAEVQFNVPNSFGVPSDLGTYPAGTVFTDNERNYKVTDAAQTHSETSGNAIPFTSIAAYNASFPEGATIRDEKARHAGRTIKQANIKPLRSNDE